MIKKKTFLWYLFFGLFIGGLIAFFLGWEYEITLLFSLWTLIILSVTSNKTLEEKWD